MKYIILLAALIGAVKLHACNACGCAAGNQSIGMLTTSIDHFAGLQYQLRWYESHHDGIEANKPAGKEYYQTLQAWGRFALSKGVQLFAFVPYQYNEKLEGGTRHVLSGVGDITVLANVQLLRPESTCGWRHYLQAGGGVKAPTGAYDDRVLGSGDDLAPSMQAGTGSWDVVVNANYTLQHDRRGLNAECVYTRTLPNHQDYKYGNRLSGSVQAFYQCTYGRLQIIPLTGIRYECSAKDYDNYTYRSEAPYTGGYMLYASARLQMYTTHYRGMLSCYLPVAQHYGDGLVKAGGKAEAGIMYVF